MKDNIALGFILFNPSKDSVKRIVDTAITGYEIFVFLNSKLEDEALLKLKSVSSIHVFDYNSNQGLSTGLSSVCNAAFINKNKGLLYFDQDSIFTFDTLDYVKKYFSFIQNNGNDFTQSIVCTAFRDATNLNRRYNHITTIKISDFLIENVYFTINSGSLYFLEKFQNFEWFDKRYFVDGVDYSFCVRSLLNKFKITEIYNTPGLDHETEQGNMPVIFLSKQIKGRVYSISRNIDFLKSHLLVLLACFRLKSIKPKIFIIKSICAYIYIQVVLRIKVAVPNNPRTT
jgi:rhamnosyltransferase